MFWIIFIGIIVIGSVCFKLWDKRRKKQKIKYNKKTEGIYRIINILSDFVLTIFVIISIIGIINNITFYFGNTPEKQSKTIIDNTCRISTMFTLNLVLSGGNPTFYTDSTSPVNDIFPKWEHLEKMDNTFNDIGSYDNNLYYIHLENEDNFWFALVKEVEVNGNVEANDMGELEQQIIKTFDNLPNGYSIWKEYCSDKVLPITYPTGGRKLYFVIIHTFKKIKSDEQKLADETKYKQSCQTIQYKKLLKDSTPYIGEKVYYKWKIIQAMTKGWFDIFRLAVTNGLYWWDDVLWIISEKTEFVEDDFIEVRWEVREDYCYTTVDEKTLCIPSIKTKYIK